METGSTRWSRWPRNRSSLAPSLLLDLAGELARLRVDLTQYAETYHCRDGHADASLPAMLGVVPDLTEVPRHSPSPDVRYAGELLDTTAADYLRVVDELFLRVGGPAREICSAYADDHGHRLAVAG